MTLEEYLGKNGIEQLKVEKPLWFGILNEYTLEEERYIPLEAKPAPFASSIIKKTYRVYDLLVNSFLPHIKPASLKSTKEIAKKCNQRWLETLLYDPEYNTVEPPTKYHQVNFLNKTNVVNVSSGYSGYSGYTGVAGYSGYSGSFEK